MDNASENKKKGKAGKKDNIVINKRIFFNILIVEYDNLESISSTKKMESSEKLEQGRCCNSYMLEQKATDLLIGKAFKLKGKSQNTFSLCKKSMICVTQND